VVGGEGGGAELQWAGEEGGGDGVEQPKRGGSGGGGDGKMVCMWNKLLVGSGLVGQP
jgi:hypothetical protein